MPPRLGGPLIRNFFGVRSGASLLVLLVDDETLRLTKKTLLEAPWYRDRTECVDAPPALKHLVRVRMRRVSTNIDQHVPQMEHVVANRRRLFRLDRRWGGGEAVRQGEAR